LKSLKLSWLLLLFLLIMMLSACGKVGEPAAPADTNAPPQLTETPEDNPEPEPALPAYTAPLTGLPLEEPLTAGDHD